MLDLPSIRWVLLTNVLALCCWGRVAVREKAAEAKVSAGEAAAVGERRARAKVHFCIKTMIFQ